MEERSQTMLCKKSRFRVKSNSLLHKSVVVALLIAVCGVGSVNAAQVMKVGGARDVVPLLIDERYKRGSMGVDVPDRAGIEARALQCQQ